MVIYTAEEETSEGSNSKRSRASSHDEIFQVLANRRRRQVLDILSSKNEEVTMRELSERITAHELDVDRSEVTYSEQRKRYVTLQRTHLPKLEESGLIEYDKENKIVRKTQYLEDIRIYKRIQKSKIGFQQESFYILLSFLWLGILTLSYLNVPPLDTFQPIFWVCVFIFIIATSSLIQILLRKRLA